MGAEAVIDIELGGADPLAAAAVFHQHHLRQAMKLLGQGYDSIVLRFDYAEEKPHRWRKEAVAALARAAAPARVNGVAPASEATDRPAIDATIAFLHGNGGVTGQLLMAGTLGGA